MNIIITPLQKTSPAQVFRYVRMIQRVITIAMGKNPNSPKMAVTVDDFTCTHKYRFTGNVTPNENWAIAQCEKCNLQIVVRPGVVNATESIEATNHSTGSKVAGGK